MTGVVYYVGATVFETINIALAFILLLFSGISLKSYILNIVSVWLLILSPIIVCSKIEGDYLAIRTEESRILAYNEILSSLRPINILIYIIYISIGVFYIGKRRIVNDGIN